MKIKLNSPTGTPQSEMMFVVENPSVSREKMSYTDVTRGIEQCNREIKGQQGKKVRLQEIKTGMDALLK